MVMGWATTAMAVRRRAAITHRRAAPGPGYASQAGDGRAQRASSPMIRRRVLISDMMDSAILARDQCHLNDDRGAFMMPILVGSAVMGRLTY